MAGTAVKARRHNLPVELTSFVGRRREMGEVKRLLTTARLLTLTGSAGAGKTRLALRAAASVARCFADGVWLVSLAPIEDPLLVTQAVFTALGLQDVSSRWSLSTLSDHLADKRLLLILDNCEHLLDGCAVLAGTLLKSCPDLQIMATSRQALGMTGEVRMRVPPLSLPEDNGVTTPERVVSFDAVALLLDRASAVLPGFNVDPSNAASVVSLCRRLDGIPLALELAAVRLEGLTVDQLLAGLERELPVLGTGDRGAEARQRTLEATIGWSYSLLDEHERRLWARLSIFAGGFDAGAAVQVCSGPELPVDRVIEVLASLVEKSIIQRDMTPQPPRYSILEMVRQYGRQRLREFGEEEAMQAGHRDWILALAGVIGAHDERQAEAFHRIRSELDNLWSALDSCRRRPHQAVLGAEICFQLIDYWLSRGPLRDARRTLDSLAALTEEYSVPRARCLHMGAMLAGVQNDVAIARDMAEEALRIGHKLGDAQVVCWASGALLFAAIAEGKTEGILSLTEPMLSYARSTGNWYAEAIALNYTALIQLAQGAVDEAVHTAEEALARCRRSGDIWVRGLLLNNLAEALRRRGDLEQAEELARDGAVCKHTLDDRRGLAGVVETLAWVACDRGAAERAATLLGRAQRLRESIAVPILDTHQARHEACEQSARSLLGRAAFASAFQRGMAISDEEAIAFELEQSPAESARPAAPGGDSPARLTRRELEIARLIAEGRTTRQIATALFISERTVETHVTNMLNKLGLNSRIQLTRWVAGLGEPAQG